MARIRNIKHGFFTSEQLADCSAPARLCFAGLWVLADREGRLEDRPRRIKAELFSYDDWNVDELLNELAKVNLIERYEVGGVRYIQVTKFKTHQNPHPHEVASKLPPSPSNSLQEKEEPRPEEGKQEPAETSNDKKLQVKAGREMPHTSRADYGNLIKGIDHGNGSGGGKARARDPAAQNNSRAHSAEKQLKIFRKYFPDFKGTFNSVQIELLAEMTDLEACDAAFKYAAGNNFKPTSIERIRNEVYRDREWERASGKPTPESTDEFIRNYKRNP